MVVGVGRSGGDGGGGGSGEVGGARRWLQSDDSHLYAGPNWVASMRHPQKAAASAISSYVIGEVAAMSSGVAGMMPPTACSRPLAPARRGAKADDGDVKPEAQATRPRPRPKLSANVEHGDMVRHHLDTNSQ